MIFLYCLAVSLLGLWIGIQSTAELIYTRESMSNKVKTRHENGTVVFITIGAFTISALVSFYTVR